jgi:hypothetical protein
MNKRLLKGKIKLTEDVKKALPRCLWRVEFPPPRDEIVSCNATCGKILGSIESKRLILLTFVIIFVVMYLLYIYLE